MAISQELENAIRGSIHSPAGAADLIDLCNGTPFAGSLSEVHASYLTALSGISAPSITGTNAVFATAITVPTLKAATLVSANSVKASNISVGVGATVPAIVATELTVPTIVGTDIVAAGTISAASGNFTSNLLAKSSLVTSLSAANATVGTNITVGSVMSAASANIQSNLTAKSVAATTVNVASALIVAGSLHLSGGTAANTTQGVLLSHPVNYISVSDATKNYFVLPGVTAGLCRDVINCLNSTAGLIGVGSVSINGATSQILATNGAVGGSYCLICDGTSWWKRAT